MKNKIKITAMSLILLSGFMADANTFVSEEAAGNQSESNILLVLGGIICLSMFIFIRYLFTSSQQEEKEISISVTEEMLNYRNQRIIKKTA